MLLYQDRKHFHAFLVDTTRWLFLKAKCQCAILTRRTLSAPPLYQPPFTACLSDHDTYDLIAICCSWYTFPSLSVLLLFLLFAKSQAHVIYIHGSGLHLVPITCNSVESVIKSFIILWSWYFFLWHLRIRPSIPSTQL